MSKSMFDRVSVWFFRLLLIVEVFLLLVSFLMLFFLLSMDHKWSLMIQEKLWQIDLILWVLAIVANSLQISLTINQSWEHFDNIIKKSKALPAENSLQSMASTLGNETGTSIKVMVSEEINDVTSIGDLSRNALIVFPKKTTELLDVDQLLGILLHEVYHVTTGARENFLVHLFRKAMTGRFVGVRVVFAVLFFTVLSFVFINIGEENYVRSSGLFFELTLVLAGLMVAVMCLMLIIAFKLIWDIRKHQGVPPPVLYAYTDELLADAYSICKGTKPEKLKTALILSDAVKAGLLSRVNAIFYRKIERLKKQPPQGKKLKEIFQMKRRTLEYNLEILVDFFLFGKYEVYRSCPEKDRISLINELEWLMSSSVRIAVQTDRADYQFKNCALHPQIMLLAKRIPEAFRTFISYASLHSTNFNLRECSEKIGIDLFDTFLLLVAAVETDVITIPSFN